MSCPRHAPQARANTNRFDAVDRADDPSALVAFLDVAKAQPAVVAAKADILELLRLGRGGDALDVGCGFGADVVAMAQRLGRRGRAVGIDSSHAMIAEARRRTRGHGLQVRFEVGDAQRLAFADDSFGASRIETVLQHVPDPERVVREMVRVTRPGGRVAALEFDLGTVFVDHPDVELSNTIRETFIGGATQGSMGRQLPRLFTHAGLVEIDVGARTVLSDCGFFHLLLDRHVDLLREEGVVTAEQAGRWWAAIDEAGAAGHFTGGATAFIVAGTAP